MSTILGFDLKTLIHWYRRPGGLAHPCSHIKIIKGYISRKLVLVVYTEKLFSRGFVSSYKINSTILNVTKLNSLTSSSKKKST